MPDVRSRPGADAAYDPAGGLKLLIDENLSPALVRSWKEAFPGTTHLFNVGLGGATDIEIWEYARSHGYGLITKDSDFEHRSFLMRSPPKVIWLRVGNRSTNYVALFVLQQEGRISEFLRSEKATMLILP